MRNRQHIDSPQVLVAVKDTSYGGALSSQLEVDGYNVERCHDASGVLRLVNRRDFNVVVLDLEIDEMADVKLISFIRRQNPKSRIVTLFEASRIEQALESIRRGAYFYLPTSASAADVALAVAKAVRESAAEERANAVEQTAFKEVAGATPAMRRVVELITKVAPTDSTVLLLGESGTGKEVLANAIHRLSPRRDNAFIAINCAALPETLLESEMFGHVKGAFTGADSDKMGLFEEADAGTIFLDEVGDMSPLTQAKLLRVLQNGEIRRVGSSTPHHVDVRVVAATNRDLLQAVEEGAFREDLYFRLNVIQIRVPPLRERLDTLPMLVQHFLSLYNEKFGRNVQDIDESAQVLLRNYDYPGNVRELESIINHAVIMSDGVSIKAEDLPDQVRFGRGGRLALPYSSGENIVTLEEMEQRMIRQALEELDGNQTEAAKRLGISRSTLWRKMKQYGLSANGHSVS